LFTAAVAPAPTNTTSSSAPARIARRTTFRASSRSAVTIRPVVETEVCVFA
jgi:hypothetical protein